MKKTPSAIDTTSGPGHNPLGVNSPEEDQMPGNRKKTSLNMDEELLKDIDHKMTDRRERARLSELRIDNRTDLIHYMLEAYVKGKIKL